MSDLAPKGPKLSPDEIETETVLKTSFRQEEDPSAEADAAVLHALSEPRGSVATIWMSVVAIAAVALIALAVNNGWFGHSDSKPVGPGEEVSAKDSWYVVRTEPETDSVLLQDFDQFKVTRHKVGSEWKGHKLLRVEKDALVFSTDDKEIRSLVAEINTESLNTLRHEVGYLRERYEAGQMDGENMKRLKTVAYFGALQESIQLLEDIATSTTQLSGQAKEILDFDREVQRLDMLAGHARGDSSEARIKAVRALGGVPSPYAFKLLRDLAMESDADLALLCIDVLYKQGRQHALGAMEQISETAQSGVVRTKAGNTLQKMIEDMKNAD